MRAYTTKMFPIETIWVVLETDGNWAIHGHQPGEILGLFLNREDAIAKARSIAKLKRCQFVVKMDTDTIDFAEDYASVED